LIRQPAIGVPIVPVPTKPIRIVVLPATSLFDRVIHVSGIAVSGDHALGSHPGPDGTGRQAIDKTAFRQASERHTLARSQTTPDAKVAADRAH